ncbi:hypothetical protein BDV10DRAFT_189802 [Aspergillus recurvatus]
MSIKLYFVSPIPDGHFEPDFAISGQLSSSKWDQLLTGFANLAGVVEPSITQECEMVRNISDWGFDWVMEMNVKRTLNCLRALLPFMTGGHSYHGGCKERLTKPATKEEASCGSASMQLFRRGWIGSPLMTTIELSNGSRELFDGGDPGAMMRRSVSEEVAEVISLLRLQSSFLNGVVIPIDGVWVC